MSTLRATPSSRFHIEHRTLARALYGSNLVFLVPGYSWPHAAIWRSWDNRIIVPIPSIRPLQSPGSRQCSPLSFITGANNRTDIPFLVSVLFRNGRDMDIFVKGCQDLRGSLILQLLYYGQRLVECFCEEEFQDFNLPVSKSGRLVYCLQENIRSSLVSLCPW